MKKTIWATGILLLLTPRLFAGFSVTPFILSFDAATKGNARFVEAYHLNDQEKPVPVELSVRLREVDINGKIIYREDVDVSGDFVIYPERIILMPKERQRIQIKYVGDPRVFGSEKVYAILATEVDIAEPQSVEPRTASGEVMVKSRYAILAVMRPDKPRPNVKVDSIRAVKDAKGQNMMSLVLNNTGTGMQKLENMTLVIIGGKEGGNNNSRFTLRPDIEQEVTKNSLFPGFQRRLVFPWPTQVPLGEVKAIVSFGN